MSHPSLNVEFHGLTCEYNSGSGVGDIPLLMEEISSDVVNADEVTLLAVCRKGDTIQVHHVITNENKAYRHRTSTSELESTNAAVEFLNTARQLLHYEYTDFQLESGGHAHYHDIGNAEGEGDTITITE